MFKSLASSLLVLPLAGCITHRVSFGEIQPSSASQKRALELVAVIDKPTREKSVRISSAMAGAAHKWMVQAGEMLVQVSNTEFPALFERYSLLDSPPANGAAANQVLVELAITDFQFRDFRTTVTVSAHARGEGGAELFSKSYTGHGQSEGGKVFLGGAFAMKSAIRQSSHTAFVEVFSGLAADLQTPVAP